MSQKHNFHHLLDRTFFLASLAGAQTAPNPKVGALILHNNQIIGEGFHRKAGEPHAEVNAINQVQNKSLLQNSKLFVSLEPCCFHGKTPACTNLIRKYKIPEVHILTKDPNPKVAGQGIKLLQNAGIRTFLYEKSPDAEKYKILNRAFFYNQIRKKTYLTLKWAQDLQNTIGSSDQRILISGFASQVLTHRLRANHQAILIGVNTFLIDKPKLNVRFFPAQHQPLKIILDFYSVLKPSDFQKTNGNFLILNRKIKEERSSNLRFVIPSNVSETSEKNWNWIELKEFLLQELHISSVLVEGGKQIIETLLQQNAADEILRFQANRLLSHLPAPLQVNIKNFQAYHLIEQGKIQKDNFIRLIHKNNFTLFAKSETLWKGIY